MCCKLLVFMPLTLLYSRFIKLRNISASVFELYFDWFFCCCNEKGNMVARSAKINDIFLSCLFLHHCGRMLLADFVLNG